MDKLDQILSTLTTVAVDIAEIKRDIATHSEKLAAHDKRAEQVIKRVEEVEKPLIWMTVTMKVIGAFSVVLGAALSANKFLI